MQYFIYYHKSDFDGLMSAAIVRQYLVSTDPVAVMTDSAKFIGIDYGEDINTEKMDSESVVFFVDYTPPVDLFLKIRDIVKNIWWVDHHKNAVEAARQVFRSSFVDGSIAVPRAHNNGVSKYFFLEGANIIDACSVEPGPNGLSACELTWQLLRLNISTLKDSVNNKDDENAPEFGCLAVRALGRFDVWDHGFNLEFDGLKTSVLGFQYGASQYGLPSLDSQFWTDIFDNNSPLVTSICQTGEALKEFDKAQCEKIAKYGMVVRLKKCPEHKILAINTSNVGAFTFESVYDPKIHDACMAYYWKADHWKISIRTRKVDGTLLVSADDIARAYGGNGHQEAAGFTCADIFAEFIR